jgi:hypothetical protein
MEVSDGPAEASIELDQASIAAPEAWSCPVEAWFKLNEGSFLSLQAAANDRTKAV